MAAIAERLLTAEEFLDLLDPEDGSKQELVRGEVVTMAPPPGFLHGLCQVRIASILDQFVRQEKLGRVTTESGIVTERDPDTVRGPDVAFWSVTRIPLDQTPVGYPDVAADLAVEVLSSRKTLKAALAKLGEYVAAGVRMVWIVDPEAQSVTVYRQPDEGRVLHAGATLSGEEVVPGFSCKVSEFFQ